MQISSDGGRAVLTCGSATFNLLTMPEDEYPALPKMPPAAGTVGSDAFATAVSQSAIAAGRDDTLPSLTGVRIEIEGDTLTLISTDRYRLAVRELRWTPGQTGPVRRRARPGPGAHRHRPVADLGRRGLDRAGPARRRPGLPAATG